MSDVLIRVEGAAGRITLNRPKALNSVTWGMIQEIHAALTSWRANAQVKLVIIDAAGDRAFAAGGDIVDLYHASRDGDLEYGRRFWAEEYRMNIEIAEYPKPVVTFMHGFTMGGGVGVSCHASHRIMDETVQIAMPECGIGLIPDVGGSWLLANAPMNFGVFIGLTGYRMGPGDALYAKFADAFVPRTEWENLIDALVETGDPSRIETFKQTPDPGNLEIWPETSRWFAAQSVPEILDALEQSGTENGQNWIKAMRKNSPLAVVAGFEAIRAAKSLTLREAFEQEYRFVFRAVEQSDFLEGIRALVIDKDRTPVWRHASIEDVPRDEAAAMLAQLGQDELKLEENV